MTARRNKMQFISTSMLAVPVTIKTASGGKKMLTTVRQSLSAMALSILRGRCAHE